MNIPIIKSVTVDCELEHAFNTFTNMIDLWWPKSHRRFEQSTLSIEAFVGGRFLERAADGSENVMGEVISCDPPHAISYTWNPGKITGPTMVEIKFIRTQQGTDVHVTHSEGDAELGENWQDRAKLFESGWDIMLPLLSEYVKTHKTKD